MSNLRRAPTGAAQAKPNSILKTLQATELIVSKPVLPAEILVAILDYLPVPDMMRFARTSRRLREMVYDDTRWVARLRSLGCWDEAEARRRFEETMRRRRELADRASAPGAAAAAAGGARPVQAPTSTTLFDAAVEVERRNQSQLRKVTDGFETMKATSGQPPRDPFEDPEALLQVIKSAKSVRGHAREEYGKIYGALAPFYLDLVRAKTHTDPIVFQVFRDPERQAQMLANLRTFAKSDWAQGWQQREEKLASMISIFESAVLREFEQGYEFWDVDGRMKKYAHVLDTLSGDGGSAGVELFIHKHPIFADKEVLANSMDCINQAPADEVVMEPSRRFFEVLSRKVNAQADIIERIFPRPGPVFWQFVGKVREDIITEYATPLFDETHERSILSYVKAVSGLFEQTLQFFRTLTPPKGGLKAEQEATAKEFTLKIFEPHLDLYLQDELDYFVRQAEREVGDWEKKLSEQDASVESFYMGSFVNRQADKRDFLTSFKKVVMMPVSVLPTSLGLPLGSPFASSSSRASAIAPSSANGNNSLQVASPSAPSSRPHSPGIATPTTNVGAERTGSPLPGGKAPSDELAAKTALMTSRLEGIKSLFSIEVALSLVHQAKATLGRIAVFIQLGGQAGGEAREQCETIFVQLLRILGGRHVKAGFDKAVTHLSQYNARAVEASQHDKGGVAPLVTFIELVNVGDLISQMIDVFYEQQLAGPKIADRNDFLDPAGLAKKKFEQMLDESVAAGLNKGIDVLMDEVEYICATTQLPTDYNPAGPDQQQLGPGTSSSSSTTPAEKAANAAAFVDMDIGPTHTAKRVRDLVASHTSMLVGSTDKSMLDVFNGEVGLRLFAAVCKNLKRQRVSTAGAIKLIADMNLYFDYIRSLKNQDLLAYFKALRELSQIYLIDEKHAKEMATIIADGDRFGGIFRAEEVYEYAERRADWYHVRKDVERAMYGLECVVM
ncbi:exocyst complex component Sec10-like protein [Podospora appendiculata]|uniref:Exocyst complex component Sec10-like protein n=1 Tax=Podospora appendiculata TaxID=314037 RepID=A0AAE0WYL1_9PEZI|nr:exocyst complex component Sec10-like protein [Podospora appendiculata]KAK3685919.1 exocyst complex component Sec10-like protein [Podospora appendiculata]